MSELNKSEYNMNDVKDAERYLIDARNRMEEINTEVEAEEKELAEKIQTLVNLKKAKELL